MILEKHLTIREAKNEIKRLENQLDLYATKKNINFLKTQPGAVKLKDLVVDSSSVCQDLFLSYNIKEEELNEKIRGLVESIKSYRMYILNELSVILENMRKKEKVVYLKNVCGFNFKEIAKILNKLCNKNIFNERQCKRLYGRRKL